jgi:Ca2+-transporting ATPase
MPVHVVFLEFVIDPACTLVFEAEQTGRGAMRRPPRDPRAPLFDAAMLGGSLLLGAAMLACVFGAYWWALASGRPEDAARAIAFVAIVSGNLALIFAMRSRTRSVLQTLGERNVALWAITAGALAALVAVLYVPPAAALFRFSPPGAGEFGAGVLAGVAGVLGYELWKGLRRRR